MSDDQQPSSPEPAAPTPDLAPTQPPITEPAPQPAEAPVDSGTQVVYRDLKPTDFGQQVASKGGLPKEVRDAIERVDQDAAAEFRGVAEKIEKSKPE